jgi:hypothetical protein
MSDVDKLSHVTYYTPIASAILTYLGSSDHVAVDEHEVGRELETMSGATGGVVIR